MLTPRNRRSRSADRNDLEKELELWLGRLRAVDQLIEGPARTLVDVADYFLCLDVLDPHNAAAQKRKRPFDAAAAAKPLHERRIPTWIGVRKSSRNHSILTHALCSSTLQRLARHARRWSWDFTKQLQAIAGELPKTVSSEATPPGSPQLIDGFDDEIFSALNPLTSAEVFWVLLNSGEAWTHGPSGFIAMFGMLWGLYAAQQAYRDSIEDSRPLAATVVSKCLMPLKRLEATITFRAGLYRRLEALCGDLVSLAGLATTHDRWRFTSGLDRFSALLSDMQRVAINPDDWAGAAKRVGEIAAEMRPNDISAKWEEVQSALQTVLIGVGVDNEKLLEKARQAVDMIEQHVVTALQDEKSGERFHSELRPRLTDEEADTYRTRMVKAASAAVTACRRAVGELGKAVAVCGRLSAGRANIDTIRNTLAELGRVNDRVASFLRDEVAPSVQWSRRAVRQEVAYASAGNDTEFDAAELLSAIAIAERWEQISKLEVADAIGKALRAGREDGSWTTGQPMYSRNRVLGVWPATPDIVWLLATAINGQKRIRVADESLAKFVDWLARNVNLVEHHVDDSHILTIVGWSSATREQRTIDLWTTAGSINALLEIRELIEFRLWELCERRFFVLPTARALDEVDPVDLGSRHDRRVHHLLRRTARESRGANWKEAKYSFVLHGPPGSSKTAIAEALGTEMAGSSRPRVVRVTPADFTRRGEAGVDAEARFIFDLLTHVRRVTIIFDEIDDLLRRRELKGGPSFLKMVVPAMLNRLQDLRDAAPRQELCYVVAMNYVDNVEPALVRPGRIDAAIPVVYPDSWSRENTLERLAKKEKAESRLAADVRTHIVNRTVGWPWTTFQRMCAHLLRDKQIIEIDAVEKAVKLFESELQEVWQTYLVPERWNPFCPQLGDEVAHLAASLGDDPDRCVAAFTKQFAGPAAGWTVKKDEVEGRITLRIRTLFEHEARTDYTSKTPAPRSVTMGGELLPDRHATVRVWAPGAKEVSVDVGESGTRERLRLTQETPAIWAGDVQNVVDQMPYRFVFELPGDDGNTTTEMRNDPWGRDVTADGRYSVMRNSVRAPEFSCPGWHELVIYQIDVRGFSGLKTKADYDHVDDEKLALLQTLGVNAIDLLSPSDYPLNPDADYNPAGVNRRWKTFGGVDALRRLVQRAHGFGIAVIVGVSTKYHLGRGDIDLRHFTGSPGGPLGIYFETDSSRLHTPYGPRPAFDRSEVVELMCGNARRWIAEVGVDGLRWEGIHFVRADGAADDGEPDTAAGWQVLRAVNQAVKSARSGGTITIAADEREPPRIVARGADGTMAYFGAQHGRTYTETLRRAIIAPGDLNALGHAIRSAYGRDAFARVNMFDTVRGETRLAASLAKLSANQDDVHRRIVLATACLLATPGIPMLVAGQEFASVDRAIDWKRREEMQYLVTQIQTLIHLRRDFAPSTTPGLKGHSVFVDVDNERKVLTIHRWQRGRVRDGYSDEVVIVLNFSAQEMVYSAPVPWPGAWTVRFNSDPASGPRPGDLIHGSEPAAESARIDLRLGRYGVVMLSQTPPPD